MNGDDIFTTFATTSEVNDVMWWYSRIYLYFFVALFIYVILSVFISVIMDTYEHIKVCYLVYFFAALSKLVFFQVVRWLNALGMDN